MNLKFKYIKWLFPITTTLHNLEEAIYLPEWTRKAGYFHMPVRNFEFRFAVGVLTLLCWTITYLSSKSEKEDLGVYILTGYSFAMFINVFFPHVISTAVTGSYTPGLLTGVALILPANTLVICTAFREGYISSGRFLSYSALVILTLIILIPLLINAGKLFV